MHCKSYKQIMKRHLISFASLMLCTLPTMAIPQARDYSINGRHDSSLMVIFGIVLVGFFIYEWIRSMFNDKNKK